MLVGRSINVVLGSEEKKDEDREILPVYKTSYPAIDLAMCHLKTSVAFLKVDYAKQN